MNFCNRLALVCIALCSCVSSCVVVASDIPVKIIAFNDFHGQLEAPGNLRANAATASPTIPVGGVEWMAAYVDLLKAKNPHNVVVSAGDLIGATPLTSALFHDEPTIEAMNRLGLEFNAVGNHEFDEGRDELLRMQNGGCHPQDTNSCQGAAVGTPVPFEGASFAFLAANVHDTASKKTLFAPYAIKTFGKVRVAFIGMTLKETPTIVSPSGVAGLEFTDEAATVNALIPKLRARGVRAVVVLIHQGGTQPLTQAADTINSCAGNLSGTPIAPIVNRLDDEVDLVISGHTHQAYNCVLPNKSGRLISVTSANSIGRVLTDIDVAVNPKTGDIKSVAARNIVVDRAATGVVPNAEIASIVSKYRALAMPIANRVLGEITAAMPDSGANAAGESALGDVIADAQLQATSAVGMGEAVAAFMNPGGIRAPGLLYPSSAAAEGDGKVTYGEIFTVQPFGNSLTTLRLTGEQLHIMLEQQFTGCHAGNAPAAWNYPASDITGQSFNRVLQVSAGFTYAWSANGPACDKVNPDSIKLNGMVIDPNANYSVTVNNFLADGGDKFYILAKGSQRLGGAQDVDALEAFFKNVANDADPIKAGVQIAPGPQNRISRLD
ncbi:MAG TPA: bifunctional metallophosphatase/5'-nucleotidase [Cellvibrio sp.]|nr:bifunctional metallophosphatase/5'-nucleotidase [Cellvibrio sp.]